MNLVIKNLLDKAYNGDIEAQESLKELEKDINFAKEVLSGKFTYCEECNDYYLADSFMKETSTKPIRICIYKDPINSGGNEYDDGYAEITYSVCPKGHKVEISYEERTLL